MVELFLLLCAAGTGVLGALFVLAVLREVFYDALEVTVEPWP